MAFGVWAYISDGVTVIHKYNFIAKKLKINKLTLFLSISSKEKQMVLVCQTAVCYVWFFVWYFYVGQTHGHDSS